MGRETEEQKLGGSGLWDKALKIEKLYQRLCALATLIITDKLPTKETVIVPVAAYQMITNLAA